MLSSHVFLNVEIDLSWYLSVIGLGMFTVTSLFHTVSTRSLYFSSAVRFEYVCYSPALRLCFEISVSFMLEGIHLSL